jgi:hypothetical protein
VTKIAHVPTEADVVAVVDVVQGRRMEMADLPWLE